MIYDPHINSHDAKNLDYETWVILQGDSELLELATDIRDVINRNLVGDISYDVLDEIGFQAAACSGMKAVHLQSRFHYHWAGIALTMLTGTSMEPFDKQKFMRFQASEGKLDPLYRVNVVEVKYSNLRWPELERKALIYENEITRPARNGKDDQTYGTTRGRDRTRDETRQISLFDLH